MEQIWRCELCNKPFDKQTTLKRHLYYCRSRKGANTSRSRACLPCAKGKARCDGKQPACSRCTTKAIECLYPAHVPNETGSRPRRRDSAQVEQQEVAPSSVPDSSAIVGNGQEESNQDDVMSNSSLVIANSDFATLEGDWNCPLIDFNGFLNSQGNAGVAQYSTPLPTSPIQYPTTSAGETAQMLRLISPPTVSIPLTPGYPSRALLRRPGRKNMAQKVANLMLHILKSYPLMMLCHNTLPPFIHPALISIHGESDCMEPLTNCINLVRMISSEVRGSRKLFWRNVRQECERLCVMPTKLSKWELLAAMQALSIYILIKLEEGETEHNNFDFLLITTVTVVAKEFAQGEYAFSAQREFYDFDPRTVWKDWIFEESKRRACVLFQVVNMLVYFEPATMCTIPNSLILAPLPSRKALWEANDELAWRKESEKEPLFESEYGLAADGDLVKIHIEYIGCTERVQLLKSMDQPKIAENWEQWCSGMDSLGSLVMLAASLIS